MGILLKVQISEREAAGIFLGRLSRDLHSAWPQLFEALRPSFPKDVALIDNEQAAIAELFLAVVATHLASLEEVFDPGRARRLRAHVNDVLSSPPFCRVEDAAAKDHQREALQEYGEAWSTAREGGTVPDEALAALLHRRLGASYGGRAGNRAPGGEETRAIVAIFQTFGVSWWRFLSYKYRIRSPKRPRRWHLPWRD